MTIDERLSRIRADLRDGRNPDGVSVRDLLGWFGAQRRGLYVVHGIRSALERHGLMTAPDFEGAYIDHLVAFVERPEEAQGREESESAEQEQLPDPTYRIGRLASANVTVVSVNPDDSIRRATSLMLTNDFSQLPVMTSDREVRGMISWTSLGSRMAVGQECDVVRDCMEPHQELSSDASLFAAIQLIVDNQYVLVRDPQRVVTGIVTTSDLSVQFRQLGEPFLLIGEIENYVRRLIQDRFTVEQLAQARNPADAGRVIESASDLTFGEYRRLLEAPERWEQLALPIDRRVFVERLDAIRRIRNDVMHFDPDGIPDSDLEVLRDFVGFLQRLANMKAI